MQHSLKLFLWATTFVLSSANAQVYSGRYGKVKFTGSASQELIVGQSLTLQGEVDFESGYVAFDQPLNRFYFYQGDEQKNAAEQRVLETSKYPLAFFRGKMINDFTARFVNGALPPGSYPFSVNGLLSIHGVDNELKVTGECVVQGNTILLKANFRIFLSDFNVVLPKLATQKASEEVNVSIEIKMGRQEG